MESIARAFASPYEAESATLPALVALRVFERTRKTVLSAIDPQASDAAGIMIAAIAPPASGTWKPELGMVSHALEQQPMLAALQFILAFHHDPFEFTCTLEREGSIFLDGHVVSVAGDVHVLATEGMLTLRSQAGDASFGTRHGRKVLVDSLPLLLPPGVDGQGFYMMAPVSSARPAIFPDPLAPAHSLSGDMTTSTTLVQAFAALDATRGAYGTWVRGALAGACMVPKGNDVAATSPRFPGLVALPCGLDRLDYIEVLVVAACHQRLCQLALVMNLGAAGREEVQYVPARRSYLTSRRALTAAHEHINVLLALESVEAEGAERRDLERRIERRRLMLATDCLPILDTSDILSEGGAELWRRLKTCLEDHGDDRVHDVISLVEPAGNESVGPQILVAGVAT